MLAGTGLGYCNAHSATHIGLMTRKRFLLPDFDACSVALFASLVFMGPQPGRAQQLPVRAALSGPALRQPSRAPAVLSADPAKAPRPNQR